MADDLATLSLRLSNEQAIADAKATGAALEEMGNKGERARDKLGRFAGSSDPVADALKRQAAGAAALGGSFQSSGGHITDATRRMTLLQIEAIKMNEALSNGKQHLGFWASLQAQAAGHTGEHSLAVGRLEKALANIVGHFLGANAAAELLGSGLLKFAVGTLETAGILGGLALLVGLYEHLSEGAREAKKQIDDMTKSLVEQARAAREATVAGRADLLMIAESNQQQIQKESGAGWRTVLERSILGTTRTGLATSDAENQAKRLADAQTAVDQAYKNWMDAVDKQNEEAARKAKEAFDRAAAAARKAQEDIMRYNALINSQFGGSAPNEMTSAQRAAWLANQHGRTMTDTELSAITGPMAQSVVDEVKSTTAAAVDLAVRAYKDGTGRVLTDAAREIAERNKKMLNEMQRDLASFFTDIFSKGIRSFGDLFASIKDMFLRLVADMVAANLVRRIAGVLTGLLGSLAPATAGAQAATGFAAEHARALGLTGAGAAGGLVGYGVGSSIGSPGMGALGGAASGALIGNMMLPGIGAVIGGLAGFAGGLIGGARAAREHAKALEEAQKALKVSFDSLRATVAGNTLGQALAQNASDLQKFLLQINAALPGRANEAERNRERAEATSLFGQLADQLKARSAQALQYTGEDYQVRLLAAQGQDKAAAALKLEHDQARERKALLDSFGAEIDATEQATLALADQTLAQEKLKAATDAAATSALNMVSGYKLQATVFGAMNPRGAPGMLPSMGSGDLTVKLTLSDGTVLATTVLKSFKTKAQKQFGDSSKWSEIQ